MISEAEGFGSVLSSVWKKVVRPYLTEPTSRMLAAL